MKLLILLGPQGSGNHLFSKIFALHPDVHGWKEHFDENYPDHYFIPHYKEPTNKFWNDIDKIDTSIMNGKHYACSSVSIPYITGGMPKVPPVFEFINKCESLGIETQPVVIGRDRNILSHQQTRLRGGPSWGFVPQVLRWFKTPPFFVSQELLYLYRRQYVRAIGHWLDFPTAYDHPMIDEILKEDANAKYVSPVNQPTDLDRALLGTMPWPDWYDKDDGDDYNPMSPL